MYIIIIIQDALAVNQPAQLHNARTRTMIRIHLFRISLHESSIATPTVIDRRFYFPLVIDPYYNFEHFYLRTFYHIYFSKIA